MDLESFNDALEEQNTEDQALDFCRKYLLHGTPYVFMNRDNEFYEFRKKIGIKFDIPFYEIYITGSAKLGFSSFKKKELSVEVKTAPLKTIW